METKKFTWDEMPGEEVNPTFTRKMVVGENVMLCHLLLKPGCVVPRHSHIHEQISHVIQGRVRFTMDDGTVELGPGDSLLIPSNVAHAAEVIGEETAISYDIFSPIRRDWVEGTDQYLR